jgi:hypothetical protein
MGSVLPLESSELDIVVAVAYETLSSTLLEWARSSHHEGARGFADEETKYVIIRYWGYLNAMYSELFTTPPNYKGSIFSRSRWLALRRPHCVWDSEMRAGAKTGPE